MPDQKTGSCLCHKVQYVIKGEIKSVVNCHCNKCKKMTGSAFAAIAVVAEQHLEITAGQDQLRSYAISEGSTKHFCGSCGSPIYNAHVKYPGHYMLQVGTLDDPAGVTPAVNIFCESMLPWLKGIAGLTGFAQLPPR
jgi:hypothetical protein